LLRGTDFGNVFSCALAKTRGLPGLDADRLDHRPHLVMHAQQGGEFLSPRGRRRWPVRTGSAAVRLPLARPHSDSRRNRALDKRRDFRDVRSFDFTFRIMCGFEQVGRRKGSQAFEVDRSITLLGLRAARWLSKVSS